jgi:hypothetical protein
MNKLQTAAAHVRRRWTRGNLRGGNGGVCAIGAINLSCYGTVEHRRPSMAHNEPTEITPAMICMVELGTVLGFVTETPATRADWQVLLDRIIGWNNAPEQRGRNVADALELAGSFNQPMTEETEHDTQGLHCYC